MAIAILIFVSHKSLRDGVVTLRVLVTPHHDVLAQTHII